MKNLVFLGFLAAVGFVGVGLYQGWFQIQQSSDGKSTNYSIKIDNDGLAKSKQEFLKTAQERLRGIADEIEKMRGQSTAQPAAGFAPPGGDNSAEFERLMAQKKAAEKDLEEISRSTSENFNEIKQRADRNFDELRSNFRGWKERRRNRERQ